MDDIALEEGRIDELRRMLLTHEAALAYVRLGRVVRGDATTDDTRISWNADALSTYLHHGGDGLAETPEDLADALITWLRRTIHNNWEAGTEQIWRLRAYSPKGETQLFSMRLHASPSAPAEAPPAPAPPCDGIPAPTGSAWDALDRGFRQLGAAQAHLSQGYAQFADTALGWQRRLMGIATELQQQTMEHLNADRMHLRKHAQDLSNRLDAVMGEFSTFKVELLGLSLDATGMGWQRRQSEETTAKLGEQFIKTLDSLGGAYFGSQGLTPTMAKLLKTLTDDPQLNAVINDPDLPGLLEDPANRQLLSGMLKQGLEMYRAQKQQAEAQRQANAQRQADTAQAGAQKQQTDHPDPPGGI